MSVRTQDDIREGTRRRVQKYRIKLREELGDEEYRAKLRNDVKRCARGEYITRTPMTDEERRERRREQVRKCREKRRMELGDEEYRRRINEQVKDYRRRKPQ